MKQSNLPQQGAFSILVSIFFLQPAKEVVDELNYKTIGNLTLAKESLSMCGLIPDENGTWELSQLTLELRTIVQSNLAYFNRQDPST